MNYLLVKQMMLIYVSIYVLYIDIKNEGDLIYEKIYKEKIDTNVL